MQNLLWAGGLEIKQVYDSGGNTLKVVKDQQIIRQCGFCPAPLFGTIADLPNK